MCFLVCIELSRPPVVLSEQVTAYYAPQFAELRRRVVAGGEPAFLASISRCRKWATRGGKSAVYFARTHDKRWVGRPGAEPCMHARAAESCSDGQLMPQLGSPLVERRCENLAPSPLAPTATIACIACHPCARLQLHHQAAVPQRAAVLPGVCARLLPLRGHHAAPRGGDVPGQDPWRIPGRPRLAAVEILAPVVVTTSGVAR